MDWFYIGILGALGLGFILGSVGGIISGGLSGMGKLGNRDFGFERFLNEPAKQTKFCGWGGRWKDLVLDDLVGLEHALDRSAGGVI